MNSFADSILTPRILKGKLIIFSLAMIAFVGCNSKPAPVVIQPPKPEIVSIAGGAVSIEASDAPLWITTKEIVDNSDIPVKDGTLFTVKGSIDVQVSSDGITFSDTVKVSSVKSKLTFAVHPPTQAGTYKVLVNQSAKLFSNGFSVSGKF